MLRNAFTGLRKSLHKPASILFTRPLVFSSKCFFSQQENEEERYAELRQIAKTLGIQYFRHNREINHAGDVRLLDEGNRLIGLYHIDEARKKCEELGKDLVMTNLNARPPICKAYDYKADLYQRFTKEVLEKDLPRFRKERERAVESKSLKLGAKMTVADLKNKIVSAQEMAKKYMTVRVYMRVTEDNESSGRNVIYTFRDMTKAFLKTRGEITESSEEPGAEKELDDEGLEIQTISLEFQSLIFTEQADIKDISEEELKELVQVYIKRAAKRGSGEDFGVSFDEEDPEVKELKAEQKFEYEDLTKPENADIVHDIGNIGMGFNTEADRYYKAWGLAAREDEEEDPENAMLREEVEELRLRYQGDRDQALYHYFMQDQQRRVNRVVNLLKIKKWADKKKQTH